MASQTAALVRCMLEDSAARGGTLIHTRWTPFCQFRRARLLSCGVFLRGGPPAPLPSGLCVSYTEASSTLERCMERFIMAFMELLLRDRLLRKERSAPATGDTQSCHT
jgi:hypothetical protein